MCHEYILSLNPATTALSHDIYMEVPEIIQDQHTCMHDVLVTARLYDVANLICAVDVSTCPGNILVYCLMISLQIHIFVAALEKSNYQMSLHCSVPTFAA